MNDHKILSLRKYFISISSVLFLVILLNYANSLYSPFQFDDEIVIKYYPDIKDDTYFQFSNIKYRHLFYLTFALNYHWGELNPFGYHLFNIILHFITTILVFCISFITIEKGVLWSRDISFKIASITSLLFALNPAHAETVTYISGRGSGLATFFYLLSLLFFILGSLKNTKIRFSSQLLFLLSLISCVMALFSKEISVSLPAVIILYDVCFMRTKSWITLKDRLLYYYLPFPVLAIIFVSRSSSLLHEINLWLPKFDISYALTQLKVISYVIKLFYFPINMTFDYDLVPVKNFTEFSYILTIIFLITVIFLVFKKFYQKSSILSFSVLWYFITISPTNSILPRTDLFSNRNLYLPSFGLSLFFAVIIYILFVHHKKYRINSILVPCCLMIILCSNSAILLKTNTSNKSNISLWEEALKKSPEKMRVLHNLSHYYLLNNNLKEAFVMLKRLTVFNPTNYYAHVNLGKLYLDSGNIDMAEKKFNEAIKVDTNLPEAYFNLGSIYASKGLYEKAKNEYEKADIRYDWNLKKLPAQFLNEMRAKLILNKAKANSSLGLLNDTEKELQRYLKIYPDSGEASYFLGQTYMQTGKYNLALEKFNKSKSDLTILPKAHNNIGLIYAHQNKFNEAIKEFEKAIDINQEAIEAQFNLGKIYMDTQKDKEKARIHLEKALALSPNNDKAKIIQNMLFQLNNS